MKSKVATYELTEFDSYEDLVKAREKAETAGLEVFSSVDFQKSIYFLKLKVRKRRLQVPKARKPGFPQSSTKKVGGKPVEMGVR